MTIGRLAVVDRALRSSLLAALVFAPLVVRAEALDREGIVGILPAVRFGALPSNLDNGGAAPATTLTFGFKPDASTEIGIDLGVTRTGARIGLGRYDFVGVPVLLRGSFTPTPRWDVRPVFQAGLGKELILVYGPGSEYREHTPAAAMASAGVHADLSASMGVAADVGFLYARAKDPKLGSLDGGGPFVRAGVYFRWDPVRRLGR